MLVGVDAAFWGSRRGYGRFLRSLATPTLAIDQRNDCVLFWTPNLRTFLSE